ncbi:MAG: hypothetical protein V4700_01055 [Pseudomonadota bacterium]
MHSFKREERELLSTGTRFLDHCLQYQPAQNTQGFFKSDEKTDPQSLETSISYKTPHKYFTWISEQEPFFSPSLPKSRLVQDIEVKVDKLTKSIHSIFFSFLNERRIMKIHALRLALEHLGNPKKDKDSNKLLEETIKNKYPKYANAIRKSEVEGLIKKVVDNDDFSYQYFPSPN